jgi:hypothetical protein
MDCPTDEQNFSLQDFKETIKAFVEHEMFDTLALRLFPDIPKEELKGILMGMESVDQFQSMFMYRGCQWVIENTMSQFTYSGTEYLDSTPRLFISNHRDIVLDAMMLQYILVRQELETSHVVIGANLFEVPIMPILARLNKMYSIGRGGNLMEYYRCLMAMSQQLRCWIVGKGESVWIAQRNGRTKDGIDRTNPSLVKMIASSRKGNDPVGTLAAMNITPVSVSYEWEPCAALKARETCLSQQGGYTKAPGEDTQSVMSGIMDYKGHVHFTICPPLSHEELAEVAGDYHAVAELIDRRIAEGYHLTANNRIAKQMLEGIAPEDTPELQSFQTYIEETCRQYPLGNDFRQRLLGIYAGTTIV